MRNLDVSKAENCFSDAQTYEYQLPCLNEALLDVYRSWGDYVCKSNLRRPVFLLTMPGGTRVKGTLKGTVLRASFPTGDWEREKAAFEMLLSNALDEEDTRL